MITIQVTHAFFDRAKVQRAVDKAKRREFSKAGAFVRRAARSSIRSSGKRRKISAPGKPPRSHTKRKQNLKLILFAWDFASETVVVGPVAFKNKAGANVPEALEKGGRTRIVTGPKSKRAPRRTARVRARPFMSPALEKEAPKFPSIFRNSVRP